MADVIRLKDDPHRITQELMPWYANGTLDASEAAVVEAHLETCAECRAELESERALKAMVETAPVEAEPGWAALKARIEAREGGRRAPLANLALARGGDRRRRDPARRLGSVSGRGGGPVRQWAMVAQAASLVLIAGFAGVWALQPRAPYHALSAPKAANPGNVVVIFKPTASEQQMRLTLRDARARLVDGPTASDAYVLHVADAERASTLARLRRDSQVVLAEPIDGAARP